MMISGLLLAAGRSSRMGRAKQLLDWSGVPLVRHVAMQAVASRLSGLAVVVGHEGEAVAAALADLPLLVVPNPDYATGQATSLQAGLRALPDAEAVIVLLCDQPLVTPALIDSVIAYWEGRRNDEMPPLAVVPRHNGQRGNPVLLAHPLFPELKTLTGDEGARRILQRHADRVVWLDLDDPAVTADIDTAEQYERLRGAGA